MVHPGRSTAARKPASLAQWIRRVPTEHEILGSNPRRGCHVSSMAQLVERMAVNHKVRGSNPRGGVAFCLVEDFCRRKLPTS